MPTVLPTDSESIRFSALTEEQITHYNDQGYIILSNVLADKQAVDLTAWTKEIKERTPAWGFGHMPYMEVDRNGREVLTVMEVRHPRF